MTIQEHELREEINRLQKEIKDLRKYFVDYMKAHMKANNERIADLEKKVDSDFKNWTRRDLAI